VLGVCLVDPRAPAAVVAGLLAEDFYLEKHRRLYAAVDTLVKAQGTVDLITISEALRRAGALDEIGGPAYLALLTEEGCALTGLSDYLRLLREKAGLRDIIRLGTDLVARAYENGVPPADLLAGVSGQLSVLTRRAATSPRRARARASTGRTHCSSSTISQRTSA